MRVTDLPKPHDVLLSTLGGGAVFQWNGRIYIRFPTSTHLKKPLDGFYAFDVNSSVVAHFGEDVKVTHHKRATLVLDGSTLEEIK